MNSVTPEEGMSILSEYVKIQQESNKYLKGFWFKSMYSASAIVNDILYIKIIEERRDVDNPDDAENYFLCFYCKKITNDHTPNQTIEYLDPVYEYFGLSPKQNYTFALEKTKQIYENYPIPKSKE